MEAASINWSSPDIVESELFEAIAWYSELLNVKLSCGSRWNARWMKLYELFFTVTTQFPNMMRILARLIYHHSLCGSSIGCLIKISSVIDMCT